MENRKDGDGVERGENDLEWNVTKSKKLNLCLFGKDRWRG